MNAMKPGLLVLVLFAGSTSFAQAQGIVSGFATYPGTGTNLGYDSINGGFGNYDLPGSYPAYRGYGFSGYGPGANLNGYFTASPNSYGGRVYNNMGGLIGNIQQQTGKPGSYRSNTLNGAQRPRRVR